LDFAWEGNGHCLAVVPSGELMDVVAADLIPAGMPSPAPGAPGNLDLLLEVELPVVVTFGRTQLPLKDVLKLSSGSIVELNRLANEPVEVLINNSVIARGEVVVVDGNYGIRVTEIVSRQERIRSIF
jgi:flagellar motor switch protein FliN/FliY